jgi:hypothetical protein
MAVPSTPLFGNPTRVTQPVAIKASPGKIWAIQLDGGSAASSLILYNDIDSAHGTVLWSVVAPCITSTASEASSVFINLLDLGGIDASVGIYAELAGTNAIAYVWWG